MSGCKANGIKYPSECHCTAAGLEERELHQSFALEHMHQRIGEHVLLTDDAPLPAKCLLSQTACSGGYLRVAAAPATAVAAALESLPAPHYQAGYLLLLQSLLW
jgi:hypothetical protein